MNQEELKQRLIELILEAPRTDTVYGNIKLEKPIQTAQTIVNHLIANGVTILENKESIANGTTIRAENTKFNTGDFARIVRNKCEHEFAFGTIVRLEKYGTTYRAMDINGHYCWVIDDELESADVADWEGAKHDAYIKPNK